MAWNQLVDATTITKTWDEARAYAFGIIGNVNKNMPIVKDHIYFGMFDINRSISTNNMVAIKFGSPTGIGKDLSNGESNGRYFFLSKATANVNNSEIDYNNTNGKSRMDAGDSIALSNICLIDLTQMFGTTIADYIYNLEQANAGAGVAWFKKLFPKPYYEYNAGELISVSGVSAHEMTGFNQWDELSESGTFDQTTGEKITSTSLTRSVNPIKVLPNTEYCLRKAGTSLAIRKFFYDGDMQLISTDVWSYNYREFTTPANCRYMNIAFQNSITEVCINLSWDGERDGEYEPYVKHSYPLDSTLTLRGIPKLDANNSLYYDGDEYESDGTVTRRYGVVDLGTLTWYALDGTFYTTLTNAHKYFYGICTKYIKVEKSYTQLVDTEWSNISGTGYAMWVKDSAYDTVAAFKAAMSGVYLIYELAASVTEEADPYTNPQIVDDFGTEEYVTTGIVPVGHETTYQANLRAKLEMSPDSPESDGDYFVRQTNGENTYVSLASSATIQDILARLTALENNSGESS